MIYRTLDPTTGELIERFEPHTEAEIDRRLDAAIRGFAAWRERGVAERSRALIAIADRLEAEAAELAALMALEMGKPLEEGAGEARKCAWVCRFYAEQGEALLRPTPRESDGSEAFVRYDPLGPVLAIMPWNFPFWQFFRFAAPALTAGNTVLLKHAPNTPRCAERIERLCRAAGLSEGVVQNLRLTDEQAARAIGDRRVRAVTLTGSTAAGRQVAATAGRQLKPIVLELGGSDAFIVLDDADVGRAVEVGVAARCMNNGQSCIAAKRFVVTDGAFEEFRDRFVEAMASRAPGDPKRAGTRLGPLAREDLRQRLAWQVDAALGAGGRILTGGVVPDGPGFFYPATVLVDLPPDSPAAREELFGPVAVLTRCATDEQALGLANDSDYGLGASLWTADLERARRLLPRIEAGAVFVNGLVKSDPRLPFGGVKDSGYGRELSREGLHEFVNVKTVWIG